MAADEGDLFRTVQWSDEITKFSAKTLCFPSGMCLNFVFLLEKCKHKRFFRIRNEYTSRDRNGGS